MPSSIARLLPILLLVVRTVLAGPIAPAACTDATVFCASSEKKLNIVKGGEKVGYKKDESLGVTPNSFDYQKEDSLRYSNTAGGNKIQFAEEESESLSFKKAAPVNNGVSTINPGLTAPPAPAAGGSSVAAPITASNAQPGVSVPASVGGNTTPAAVVIGPVSVGSGNIAAAAVQPAAIAVGPVSVGSGNTTPAVQPAAGAVQPIAVAAGSVSVGSGNTTPAVQPAAVAVGPLSVGSGNTQPAAVAVGPVSVGTGNTQPAAVQPAAANIPISVGTNTQPAVPAAGNADPTVNIPVSVGSGNTQPAAVAVGPVSVDSGNTQPAVQPAAAQPAVVVPSVSVGGNAQPAAAQPAAAQPAVVVPSVSVGGNEQPAAPISIGSLTGNTPAAAQNNACTCPP